MARSIISVACLALTSAIASNSQSQPSNLRSRHLTEHGWPVDPVHAQRKLQQLQSAVGARKLQLQEESVTPDGSKLQPISGCFIINMKEGPRIMNQDNEPVAFDTTRSTDLIDRLRAKNDDVTAASATASDIYQYNTTLDGFAACLSPELVKTCTDDEEVDFVEQDTMFTIDVNQKNPTWGLDRIDQGSGRDQRYNTGNVDGQGIDVYVIDTGVNPTHTEWGTGSSKRLLGGKDFAGGRRGSTPYNDCNGHGTHCAGTVLGSTYGVAKKANLWGVRVLGCTGSGSNSGILRGVDWAVNNAKRTGRPSVLSMSLGGGKSSSSNNAVRQAKNAGVTVVVAAGNENTNACSKSPASETSVITVGSTTSADRRSGFSNYGSCVDLFAPGSSIKSAWIGGSTRTNTISGTSMATPHVAGAAALELDLMKRSNAGTNPDKVWRRMKQRATASKVRDAKGSPNLLLRTPQDDSPVVVKPTPPPTPLVGCGTVSGKVLGQKCVFPFTNKGKRYEKCTTDDDPGGKSWCSTQTDSAGNHMKGNWGHCNSHPTCTGIVGPSPTAYPTRFPTRNSTPLPPTRDAVCKTTDGDRDTPCVFPFKFKGTTYSICTKSKDPDNEAWCSTKVDTDGNHVTGKGKWGHCNRAKRCSAYAPPTTQQPTLFPTALPTVKSTPLATAPITSAPQAPPTQPPTSVPSGSVKWELWNNLSGDSVKDMVLHPRYTLPKSVDGLAGPRVVYRNGLTFKEGAPVEDGKALPRSSGSRLTKSFKVTETAKYTFHITSDGPAQLWMARGRDEVASLVQIAQVPTLVGAADNSGTEPRQYPLETEWTIFADQKSVPTTLVSGQWYTMRVLHKSGAGGSPHLGVAYKIDEVYQESLDDGFLGER